MSSFELTFWKLYTFKMDLSGCEARMKPPCESFDWKTAVECVVAFVCLKEVKVPPVCISCIAITPGPAFVVVGDVAQSMVSCRCMVNFRWLRYISNSVKKNRLTSRGSVRVCGACPLLPGLQNFLSSTPVVVSFLSSTPIPAMSSGLYEVLGIAKDASPEQGMPYLSLPNIAHAPR